MWNFNVTCYFTEREGYKSSDGKMEPKKMLQNYVKNTKIDVIKIAKTEIHQYGRIAFTEKQKPMQKIQKRL